MKRGHEGCSWAGLVVELLIGVQLPWVVSAVSEVGNPDRDDHRTVGRALVRSRLPFCGNAKTTAQAVPALRSSPRMSQEAISGARSSAAVSGAAEYSPVQVFDFRISASAVAAYQMREPALSTTNHGEQTDGALVVALFVVSRSILWTYLQAHRKEQTLQ